MVKQGGRSKDERIKRMHDVQMLMQHPLMVEFFDLAEERVFEQWKASTTPEERERLWLAKQGLAAFKEWTTSLLIDGKEAERDLQRQSI